MLANPEIAMYLYTDSNKNIVSDNIDILTITGVSVPSILCYILVNIGTEGIWHILHCMLQLIRQNFKMWYSRDVQDSVCTTESVSDLVLYYDNYNSCGILLHNQHYSSDHFI